MVAETEADATINYESSEVQKFYKNGHILITGGSGFLGSLLIQKLMRHCPDLSKIYLLIRSKNGKTAEQRLEQMFQDVVFEKMRLEQPNYNEKIKLLIGDIEQPDLGLNEEDKKLITEQVNIVFHLAATVKFDEKIKKATAINVRATKDLLQLARSITNLKVFIHISTAYSHCYRQEIDEQFYDVPITPDRLIQITETLNDDELDILTSKLISKWPNTYSFTKAIAENVIQEYGKGLPIAILRPSMVISTYKDPVKSWINNYYGPVGICVAAGIGLIHSIHICVEYVGDMIPGDYVINSTIAAACHVGNSYKITTKVNENNNIVFDELMTPNETPIFNYISGNENPITWREYIDVNYEGIYWQTIHVLWYYFIMDTPYYYVDKIYQLLFHWIPAYIIDFVLLATGKKRRMVKMYNKISKFVNVISYFCTNEWKFGNNNTQALWKTLNSTDQRMFPFSMKDVNWNEYFESFIRGLRIYLLKDPIETLPKALARYRKLKIAHYCLVTVFFSIILIVVFRILQICDF